MEGDLERVAALFGEARRLEPSLRASFLETACGEDVPLRAEVEALLRAHEAASAADEVHPFVAAFPGLAATALETAEDGTGPLPTLDGFRVLHVLAAGGMGTVYVAEQASPRRLVALKVLRPEAATPEGRRRFEREAEALARLEHPGIARVHVFGTTTGPGAPRPFLAMELVHGRSLTEAAREMDLRARVSLLAEVAEAVAHAHAKGVIHRDLKPDNVLVQPGGRPKVVDFGVARLTDDEAALRTRTRVGSVVGTLAYMSPEQARGDTANLDTRSDVYSLGVVAYEALCGRHPLGDPQGTFTEIVRRIVEDEPRDPAEHDRRLRGDLRLILRTALAKEPERRYASAAALAEDLRRHLRDEPILARPLTGAYQVRRFLRRHKALAAGSAATVLALVAGLVLALQFGRSERAHRLRADRSAAAAERALAERNIELATAALDDAEPVSAARALGEVPPSLRGWEWAYLRAGTDRSVAAEALGLGPLDEARLGDAADVWMARAGQGLHVRDGGAPRQPPLPSGGLRVLATLRGRLVALVQARKEVVLVDGDGNVRFRAALATPNRVQAAATSPDGAFVAVAQDGGQSRSPVTVFEEGTGAVVARSHRALIGTFALAFAPGRRLLAQGGSWDGVVHLIDFEGSTPRERALRGHTGAVRSLAFSPDGTRIASGSDDRTVRLWDVASGEAVRLAGHRAEVLAVAFDDAGARLASAAADGSVRVWDLPRGDPVEALLGHTAAVRAVAFEPGGGALRTLGDDGLRLWRLDRDPDVLRVHRGPESGNLWAYVYGVAFSPDGRRLASAGWDGTVRVVDVATGELERTLSTEKDPVHDARWSRDGRSLVGGGRRLVRWDVETGTEAATWDIPRALACVAVPADGVHVVTGDQAGLLRLHRLGDLVPVTEWKGDGSPIADLSLAPGGDAVATLSSKGRLRVLPLGGGEARWERSAHPGAEFGAVAWSPDGLRIATGGADRTVRLWDATTGAPLASLEGHRDAVYALAWLPDGTRLFSGDDGGAVRVWDPEAGRLRLERRAHESYVSRLDVSPDGTTLASASGDNTVRLWTTVPSQTRERARREALAARASAPGEAR